MKQAEYTNELIDETSPYLLQHAHNPVNWLPWGEKALNRAAAGHKLLLISIGYSACHWCHVMEHESFEDESVAQIMNDRFVCIKIDREERPDIDQIYMTAVQLITGRGGWPLNCIALPDGRPIWGGTYFPKENWVQALDAVAKFYAENPEKTNEYATKLQEGIVQSTLMPISHESSAIDPLLMPRILKKWQGHFDTQHGGTKGAPKFMLPNNWQFLLRAGVQHQDHSILAQVKLTLQKMALGGLYDQIGGGFARYSTDEVWKVPHFEKMLYDNAQLLRLYAEAWQLEQNQLYQQVISETVAFVKRELLSPENGFYSALDADSEGEEGKFYTWTKADLLAIFEDDFELFSDYYNVNSLGFWELGQYILMRTETDESVAENHQLSLAELHSMVRGWKQKLMANREKRVRPGLDDKILASWNALTISGLVACYKALGEQEYLELALSNASFLKEKMMTSSGDVFHSYKNGKAKISGFLEDYAFLIEAFTNLFEVTGKTQWLTWAKLLTERSIALFYDQQKMFFYFTSGGHSGLIARTVEVYDNVIPSSNSVMARNLFRLSCHFERTDYRMIAREMLGRMTGNISEYPTGYSNWGQLFLDAAGTHKEVIVVGEKAFDVLKQLQKHYLPNIVFCASTTAGDLPLLKNRYVSGKTLIYICQDNSCLLPVDTVDEALELIRI